ncbi:MAG: LamG domain-containing protein [Bryobacteraceae bacterium]|jgi:hypothetical protein
MVGFLLAIEGFGQIGPMFPGPGNSVAGGSPNGYNHRATFTFNAYPASALTDFPNLILGTYSQLADLAHGGYVNNTVTLNGQTVPADLIFTSDSAGNALLSWEIESWNNATGAIVAWVKFSRTTSDDVIYAFVGKASVTTYQCTATATWSGYKGVWHLPNGTALTANDSTGNATGWSLVGSPAPVAGRMDGAGKIWRGAGVDNYINLGADTAVNITGYSPISVECWVQRNNSAAFGTLFNFSSGGGSGYAFSLQNSTTLGFTIWGVGGMSIGNLPQDTNWHHVVAVSDGSTYKVYVDGVATTPTHAAMGINSYTGSPSIGAADPSSLNNTYNVDEMRVSSASPTADWIAQEYRQQSQASAWYTVGSWN